MNNQIKARAGLALAVLTCTAVVGASLTGAARYDEGSIDAANAVAAVQGVAPNAVSNVAASTPTGDDAVVSKTTAHDRVDPC